MRKKSRMEKLFPIQDQTQPALPNHLSGIYFPSLCVGPNEQKYLCQKYQHCLSRSLSLNQPKEALASLAADLESGESSPTLFPSQDQNERTESEKFAVNSVPVQQQLCPCTMPSCVHTRNLSSCKQENKKFPSKAYDYCPMSCPWLPPSLLWPCQWYKKPSLSHWDLHLCQLVEHNYFLRFLSCFKYCWNQSLTWKITGDRHTDSSTVTNFLRKRSWKTASCLYCQTEIPLL